MRALRKEEWEAEELGRLERRGQTLSFLVKMLDTAQAEAVSRGRELASTVGAADADTDADATDSISTEPDSRVEVLSGHRKELLRLMTEVRHCNSNHSVLSLSLSLARSQAVVDGTVVVTTGGQPCSRP